MTWVVISVAILGVLNFALHRPVLRAVVESEDSPSAPMPEFLAALGGRLAFLAEFAVLVAAMLLAANGWPEMAWAYLAYTALNAMAAWLILRRRA